MSRYTIACPNDADGVPGSKPVTGSAEDLDMALAAAWRLCRYYEAPALITERVDHEFRPSEPPGLPTACTDCGWPRRGHDEPRPLARVSVEWLGGD